MFLQEEFGHLKRNFKINLTATYRWAHILQKELHDNKLCDNNKNFFKLFTKEIGEDYNYRFKAGKIR